MSNPFTGLILLVVYAFFVLLVLALQLIVVGVGPLLGSKALFKITDRNRRVLIALWLDFDDILAGKKDAGRTAAVAEEMRNDDDY